MFLKTDVTPKTQRWKPAKHHGRWPHMPDAGPALRPPAAGVRAAPAAAAALPEANWEGKLLHANTECDGERTLAFHHPHLEPPPKDTERAVGTYGNVPERLPPTRPRVSPGPREDQRPLSLSEYRSLHFRNAQASPPQQRWRGRVWLELCRHGERGSLGLKPPSAHCAARVSALLTGRSRDKYVPST